MKNSFEKNAGIALIIFTILLVFTMVLHPVGGSVERLIKITSPIVATHAVAILSLPFGWIGFWGLTRKIGTDHFGAVFAFATASLGLVAVMLAAATNGLILPIFLQHYKDATPEAIAAIKPVMRYSFAINLAFDYIYTVAFCLAILFWSIAILLTGKLAKWIGWAGIAIAVLAAAIFISGIALNDLKGFRIFVSIIVLWILLIGIALSKQNKKPASF
jgi:hypothetical protein